MACILNIFARKKKDTDFYKGAGCLFTDGVRVLAGYQPNKKSPFISGIGGSKKAGETYFDTALRETMEELFGLTKYPVKMIDELKMIEPKNVYQNLDYVNLVYSFEDLDLFLLVLNKYKKDLKSTLYKTVPFTLNSLLLDRVYDKGAEISQLVLLPLVVHNPSTPFVDPLFLKDMSVIKELYPKKRFILII
jgi:hypothetical protein